MEVGGPDGQAVLFGQRAQAPFVSAGEDRLRPKCFTVAKGDTTLVADGKDRPSKVLSAPHATGHAVHDNFDDSLLHRNRLETKLGSKPVISVYYILYMYGRFQYESRFQAVSYR